MILCYSTIIHQMSFADKIGKSNKIDKYRHLPILSLVILGQLCFNLEQWNE